MANDVDIKIGFEIESEKEITEKLKPILQSLENNNRFVLRVDEQSLTNIRRQFDNLAEYSRNLQLFNFRDIQVQFDQLTQRVRNLPNLHFTNTGINIDNIQRDFERLQTRVNQATTQISTTTRNNLLETQKVIQTINNQTGKQEITNENIINRLQGQRILYSQLLSLQGEEFRTRQQTLTADEDNLRILRERLNIIRQSQAEVGRSIVGYNIQDQERVNQLLQQRRKLSDNLLIAQNNLNNAQREEQVAIQNKIALFQRNMTVQIETLKRNYGQLVPQNSLLDFQNRINNLNSTSMKDLNSQISDLRIGFKELGNETRKSGLDIVNKDAMSLISIFEKDFTRIFNFFSVSKGINFLFREIQKGFEIVKEFDETLTTLQITMGGSSEGFTKLTDNATKLAVSMGATIPTAMELVRIYANLGENVDSVTDKLQATIAISNLANLSGKNTADIIQGLVAQFRNEGEGIAEASTRISDSLVATSANMSQDFSIGLQNMTEGLKASGALLENYGTTLEQAEGMIGGIAEYTRKSGSEIARSLSFFASRIFDVNQEFKRKTGFMNKAEQQLNKYDIKLKDASGNFRNFYDVLKDTSSAFKDMSDEEKSLTSKLIAGERNRSQFVATMNSFARVTELVTAAENSQGEAIKKNAIFVESMQGKMNTLRAISQEFWNTIINSDVLKSGISLLTEIIKSMDGFAKTFGSAGTILATFSIIMGVKFVLAAKQATIALNEQKIAMISAMVTQAQMSASTGNLAVAQVLLNNAMSLSSTGSIGLATGMRSLIPSLTGVTLGVSGLTFATAGLTAGLTLLPLLIGYIINSSERANESIKKNIDNIKELNNQTQEVDKLINQKEKLDAIDNKSEEQKKELYNIELKLAQLLPQSTSAYDEQNNALATNLDVVKKLNEEKKAQLLSSAYQVKLDLSKGIEEENNKLEKAISRRKEILEAQIKNEEIYRTENIRGAKTRTKLTESEVSYELKKLQKTINTSKKDVDDYNKSILSLNSLLGTNYETVGNVSRITQKNTEDVQNNTRAIKDNTESNKGMGDSGDELTEKIEKQKDTIKLLSDALKDYDKNNKIGYETLLKLLEKYPELSEILANQGSIHDFLIKKQDEEKENQLKNLRIKLSQNENFIKAILKQDSTLVNKINKKYSTDLQNFANLEAAKIAIKKEATNKLIAMENQYATQDVLIPDFLKPEIKDEKNGKFKRNPNYNPEQRKRYEQLGLLVTKEGVNKQKALIGEIDTDFSSLIDKFTNNLKGVGGDFDDLNDKLNKTKNKAEKSYETYESKSEIQDKFISRLNEEDDLLKKQNNTISSINDNLKLEKEIKGDKSFANQLKLENQLYDETNKKLNQLNQSKLVYQKTETELADNLIVNYGINAYADKSLTDIQKDFERVFGGNRNHKTKEDKEIFEAQKKEADTWIKGIKKIRDGVIGIDKDINQTKVDLNSIAKDQIELKFKISDKSISDAEEKVKNIENEISIFNEKSINDLSKKATLTNTLIDAEKKHNNNLRVQRDELIKQRSFLKENSMEWTMITNKAKEYDGKIYDSNIKILQQQRNLKEIYLAQFDKTLENAVYGGTREKFENEIKRKNNALQDELNRMREENDLEKEREERQKRIDEIELIQNQLYALNNNTLKDMTEEEAKALFLESEKESILKHENDLLDSQKKLQDEINKLNEAKKEHNIRQLTKDGNGNYQFEYVSDNKKIKEIQDNIDKINKDILDKQSSFDKQMKNKQDSLNKSLKDKQEDFDRWEKENNRRHEEELIQQQIRDNENQLRIRDEYYNLVKEKIRSNYDSENPESAYSIMSNGMDEISKMNNGKMDGIISDIRSKVSLANTELSKLGDLLSQAQSMASQISNLNSSASSSSSRGNSAFIVNTDIDKDMLVNSGYTGKIEVSYGNGERGADRYETLELNKRKLGSLGTGGQLPSWGNEGKIAMLHQDEVVVNSPLVNSLKELPSFIKSVKKLDMSKISDLKKSVLVEYKDINMSKMTSSIMPKISNINSISNVNNDKTLRTTYQFNIDNVSLPGVTNENGAENLVNGLKGIALQYANRR